jgi:hypothetical protein
LASLQRGIPLSRTSELTDTNINGESMLMTFLLGPERAAA